MRYLTTTEAATVLHVDPSRVRMLCKQGRISTIKVGNTYAILEGELERFAAMPRRAGRPRRSEVASQQAAARVPIERGVLSSQ
jgi:excisionase family DNA binding protein